MDNKDARYYIEQIKHFEENSYDLTKLLKQQLTVIKSSLGSVNNTLTDLEYNQEKVKKGLTQIKGYVEAATAENREILNMVAAKIIVESHIARVREAIGTLQRNLDILLQSITNARKGILEPQIVSPKLIMDALIQSMPSFPKDTSPFSLH
jgi:chromosome segregation ATPase